MKTTVPTARRAACTLAAILLSHTPAFANNGNGNGNNQIPAIPSGWLTAYPTVVQTGTKPTLTWEISYPSKIIDFLDIEDPATLRTTEELDVTVRVLGNGVTVHGGNGKFKNWVDAAAYVKHNGGSYEEVFFGDNRDVKPNRDVWTYDDMPAGDTLRFGGQYHYGGTTGHFRNSDGGTDNVRTLVRGDIPPTTEPMHLAPTLDDFLEPYLDGDGRVDIGPMDVIVFMELTHSDNEKDDRGYDLQDLVLLVSFEADKPKNNNGHGNNEDGIDTSNPGNAPWMQYDTDPNEDDEGDGGGAYPSGS